MDLTTYVKQVSLEDFGWAFQHAANWNPRLRSTGGRFFPKTGHLDFNPKHYDAFGEAVFRQIVRHELCHYHLYFQKRGYRHQDKDFKVLLSQVNGLRYAPTLPQQGPHYTFACSQCYQLFHRKRRIDTTRYRCGRCQGQLRLQNQS